MKLEVEKSQNKSAQAAATPLVTSCGWKRSTDGSFMSNLKGQFNGIVNTPMADHKICFKNTIDEKVENFRKEVHRLKRWGKFCDHPIAAGRGESLEIRSDMTYAFAAFDQFY